MSATPPGNEAVLQQAAHVPSTPQGLSESEQNETLHN